MAGRATGTGQAAKFTLEHPESAWTIAARVLWFCGRIDGLEGQKAQRSEQATRLRSDSTDVDLRTSLGLLPTPCAVLLYMELNYGRSVNRLLGNYAKIGAQDCTQY